MKKYLILFALILSFSCMKDLGTYNTTELIDPVLDSCAVFAENLEEKMYTDFDGNFIAAFSGKRIKAVPYFSFEESIKAEDYTYAWYVVKTTSIKTRDTISKSMALDTILNYTTGSFIQLFLSMTHKENGLSYKFRNYLDISLEASNGILFLSDLDGDANVGIIDGITNNFTEDLYQNVNGKVAGQNPVYISNSDISGISFNGIDICCNSGEGGVVANSLSYAKTYDYSETYFQKPEVINPQAHYLCRSSFEFIINDGNLHWRSTSGNASARKYYEGFLGDHYLSKYAICNYDFSYVTYAGSWAFIYYDDLNMKFLTFDFKTYGTTAGPPREFSSLNTQLGNAAAIAEFDPDSVGLKMVYMDRGYDGRAYALMQDPNDATKMYTLSFTGTAINSQYGAFNSNYMSYFKKEAPTSDQLDKANAFAMITELPYLFYSVGSKIYCKDLEYDQVRETVDIKNLINGKDVQVDVLFVANNYFVNDPSEDWLYIGFSEVGGTGKCGGAIKLRINSAGQYNESYTGEDGVSEKPSYVYENVMGRPVSATFKN